MSIKLYSKFHIPIPFEREFSVHSSVKKIARANQLFAKDNKNEFLFQELARSGFTVRLNRFDIKEATSFTVTSDATIYFQISIFQTVAYELAGYGNITMHQNSFNLITTPSYSAEYRTSEHSLLLPIEISFSPNFLQTFSANSPVLVDFIEKAQNGKAGTLFPVNQIASTEMLAMIDMIIEHGIDQHRDIDWVNVYVEELLNYILKTKPKTKRVKVTQQDINKIYEVEWLLEQNDKNLKPGVTDGKLSQLLLNDAAAGDRTISGDNWTIRDLAEYSSMSTYTFVKTFREIFGNSVANYLKEQTWQDVLILLLGGDENLKSISAFAGYNDQPSFSRAFKNRFGSTPSEFVQEMTKKLRNYKKTANRN